MIDYSGSQANFQSQLNLNTNRLYRNQLLVTIINICYLLIRNAKFTIAKKISYLFLQLTLIEYDANRTFYRCACFSMKQAPKVAKEYRLSIELLHFYKLTSIKTGSIWMTTCENRVSLPPISPTSAISYVVSLVAFLL